MDFRRRMCEVYSALSTDDQRRQFFEILAEYERARYSFVSERDVDSITYEEFFEFAARLHTDTERRLRNLTEAEGGTN